MKNILKYSLLIGLIVGVVSCDKLIYDDFEEQTTIKPVSKPTVYLSITRSAHTDGEESINKDEIDFEDRVHDLAMFVFDSATGNIVGEPYFESDIPISNKSKMFTVVLTPGQRDFYFVANMPKIELAGITTKAALEAYMKSAIDLDVNLYMGATETKGFPMSRIYLNQSITDGGTIYNPIPFKPDGDDRVKLQRVVAQLQVDIDGTEIGAVKNVYFKNAFRKFSLLADGVMTTPEYYVETATNNALRKNGNSYIYYMPEALMNTPAWTATDHKPINYFVVETVTGTTYEIPIITYKEPIPGGNYLSFARGEKTDKPDYNIYRNNRYVFTIKSLEDIQIDYVVNPWILVQSSFYMGYGYNVSVDEDGNVTISNTVKACTPHDVKLVTKPGFTFDGGGTERIFANTDPAASASYKVLPVPTAGQAYLDLYYNDDLRYVFTIKSLEDIQIDYVVNPWILVQSSFYMGYGYNVGVDEDGNVTISNTVEACTPHDVKLETKAGFTFDGGGTERIFANTDPAASASYKVLPVPTAGQAYLDLYYNDDLVKTFTK